MSGHREACAGEIDRARRRAGRAGPAPRRPRAEDRRAEGRRAGLPAGARGRDPAAGSPAKSGLLPAERAGRGVPRNHLRLPRARAVDPRLLPRPRGHLQRAGGAQALRPRGRGRWPRASVDEAFRRCRVGRRAVHRGAGGELHRRRGRPHARPAARHAAAHLRRGRAARAAEPAVPQPTTWRRSRRSTRTRSRSRSANGWLAQNLPRAERVPVASNAEAARRAAEEAGAAAIAGEAAAERYGLKVLARKHRGRPEQHHALPGARQPRPGAHRQGPHLARDVGGEQARRGARAAHAARRAPRQHDAHRVAPGARRRLWEYLFFIDVEGHQKDDARRRARSPSSSKAPFLKILGSYPIASN